MCTGNVRRIVVLLPMTGVAAHSYRTEATIAANDERLMQVTVLALQRAIARGMAVHATRTCNDLSRLKEERDRALVLILDAVEGVGALQVFCERGQGQEGPRQKEHFEHRFHRRNSPLRLRHRTDKGQIVNPVARKFCPRVGNSRSYRRHTGFTHTGGLLG